MTKRRYDSAVTRDDLISTARRMFSINGYSATGTEDLVTAAGLTRGALYHHFGNKQGLFRAVLEAVQKELTADVNRRAMTSQGGPTEALRAGFQAYLDGVLRDDTRQILLIDGPAVLGWDVWHQIDLDHAFGSTRIALERAVDAGELAEVPLDELTHALLGALTQAGLQLGHSATPRRTREAYGRVIDLLIDGLRPESA